MNMDSVALKLKIASNSNEPVSLNNADEFNKFDWWVTFRKPQDILEHHETFLYCEIIFFIMGALTACHAVYNGGRFVWLWLATIAHGLVVESVSYFMPDIDNFWHAQSMVMFLGQRLPLHIIVFYPSFIYTACVAVSYGSLKRWAEPFAVGLTVVLLDVPFDIMGIKLLWWTWHDDDPNILDRHYWAPWTSYYFHASFSSSFMLLFFGLKDLLFASGSKFQSSGIIPEALVMILTGMFSMPLGVLQFVLVYHPLHDGFSVHSEVCVLLLLAVYGFIVFLGCGQHRSLAAKGSNSLIGAISLVVGLHYTFYMYLVLRADPFKVVSSGFHQPVGNCSSPVDVKTIFGTVLKKNFFLCANNFHEDYFDFHCLPSLPADGSEWYSICGNHFNSHWDYSLVVSTFCLFGLYWFWQLLSRPGGFN